MRDRPDAVMLFAAGFGTRMRPLTDDRPKPLISVAGRALIDHALDIVEDYGASRVVVNAHYMADMLAAHLSGRDVALSHETPSILDTGGGLRRAQPLLGPGPVLTMNSDAVWRGENPLRLASQAWDGAQMDALLLCLPAARATGHDGPGDFTLGANGRLMRGGDLVFTGVQVIRPEILSDIPAAAFSLNVVWDRLAHAGRLFGATYTGDWCDVGHPGGIALAERMIGGADV
ncbi:MAG: nucleotidyltransferase family protein [Sediminimonas qiaohouensis]|uniref:Nucleotidyltransferase family protein n=1 Tax=Sediminimonas qiaohouensis TaxID=552061 RepID=A0A7C9HB35_9RHOB|nr:nucleotidyltransferase family protein [Sediminimonas qiaohouensis]MTJ04630.1 nucleotidyltransferase family protein [Sediminimonas qiaohouensis]